MDNEEKKPGEVSQTQGDPNQKIKEPVKKKRHVGFIITFSIVMGLVGILFFFLSDMFGLNYYALAIAWFIYVSFVVFGYTFLIRVRVRSWIKVVSTIGAVAIIGSFVAFGGPTREAKRAYAWNELVYTDEVSLKHGKIRGVVSRDGNTNIYTGIPYAQAPVGELRWKEPKEELDWQGVKDCTYFGPRCIQGGNPVWLDSAQKIVIEQSYIPDFEYVPLERQSEDCLYLNVYSPKGATENLPVLVYIHGGSLLHGSSSGDDYNGEALSKRNIVVVTIAYRLNVFGYFAHPALAEESPNHTTGNYGLLDQIRALEWVRDNIGFFHGDKNNVTIAGESAGSSSVSALCVSPLSNGLFKKAIGESSSVATKIPPHTFRSKQTAMEMGENIMKEFNCKTIEELRAIPAETLVKTRFENNSMTVDGYALPKTPYEIYQEGGNHEEALLHGCNLQEADPFTIPQWLFSGAGSPNMSNYAQRLRTVFKDQTDALLEAAGQPKNDWEAYRIYNDIISSYWFNYPDYSWGKQAINNGENVYRYIFTKENRYMGTWHSGEIIYAYDNLEPMKAKYPYRYTDKDVALSKTMANYWVNFIKTGDPNGTGLPTWDKDALPCDKVLELGENVSMINDPMKKYFGPLENFENAAKLN